MNRDPVTIVAGRQVFYVRVNEAATPQELSLTVSNARGQSWTFNEPGWRPLAYGLAGDNLMLWSARSIIVFGDSGGPPSATSLDEDITLVFALDHAWLVVCETSVRLLANDNEVSRIELPDPVAEAWFASDKLVVATVDGRQFCLQMIDNDLVECADATSDRQVVAR